MEETCLAVIPARGGSKRIPGKNIRELCGKPLIAYTIESALKCGVFSKVVVSTDSEQIAHIAEQFGADIPFIRDPGLSDDYTPVSMATLDALEQVDRNNNIFIHVAQLMPNCPLRDSLDVVESHRNYIEMNSFAQISITRYGWVNPWWAMTLGPGHELSPVNEEMLQKRSQDLPELYCPTGAIWWARADILRRNRTFHVQGRTGWEIHWQHALDIDDEMGWFFAELLMSHRIKYGR